jgi:hypothetical protein
MNCSTEIKELAAALAAAQKTLDHARRERTAGAGSNRQYRYADLASVWDACREAITANGLAIAQATRICEGGFLLVTRLMHTSGQWIESETPILAKSNDAQAFGSAMTYARRYALSAIVGVAADDDDGEAAASYRRQPSAPVRDEPRQAPAPRPANDETFDGAHVALAAEFKRRIADLGDGDGFQPMAAEIANASLPKALLDDVLSEMVVAGVRFALDQTDLDMWVPRLRKWALGPDANDRAKAAWMKRSDEIAAAERAA